MDADPPRDRPLAHDAVPAGTTELGIDIIKVDRIAKTIERFGERFSRRVLTEGERRYVRNRPENFAGRWAAKEAVLKAIGTGWIKGVSWRDVEVRNEPGGKPVVVLRGGLKDIADNAGVGQVLVSVSHCRSHATAYAIALSRPRERE
jgi:holo-[acyl-carrier protein] synthase